MSKDDWVKKLGQWHLAGNESGRTRCGVPMLGNNYAGVIPESERAKCLGCWGTLEILREDLTGATERQLKEIFAEIMREAGVALETDFSFRVECWGVK